MVKGGSGLEVGEGETSWMAVNGCLFWVCGMVWYGMGCIVYVVAYMAFVTLRWEIRIGFMP